MHPSLALADGRAHQHDMRRDAAEAQRARKLQQPSAGHARLTLPRIQLGHPVAAIRMMIAHA